MDSKGVDQDPLQTVMARVLVVRHLRHNAASNSETPQTLSPEYPQLGVWSLISSSLNGLNLLPEVWNDMEEVLGLQEPSRQAWCFVTAVADNAVLNLRCMSTS